MIKKINIDKIELKMNTGNYCKMIDSLDWARYNMDHYSSEICRVRANLTKWSSWAPIAFNEMPDNLDSNKILPEPFSIKYREIDFGTEFLVMFNDTRHKNLKLRSLGWHYVTDREREWVCMTPERELIIMAICHSDSALRNRYYKRD